MGHELLIPTIEILTSLETQTKYRNRIYVPYPGLCISHELFVVYVFY